MSFEQNQVSEIVNVKGLHFGKHARPRGCDDQDKILYPFQKWTRTLTNGLQLEGRVHLFWMWWTVHRKIPGTALHCSSPLIS